MEEIGKILPKILESQLSQLDPPVIEVLSPFWTRVVGKALANKCRPLAFRTGTLTLAPEDGDWVESLRQMADEIRMHINHFLGRPVVRHLEISFVRKVSNAQLWRPKDLTAANAKRQEWPGRALAMPAAMMPENVRSRSKNRNRGKAY